MTSEIPLLSLCLEEWVAQLETWNESLKGGAQDFFDEWEHSSHPLPPGRQKPLGAEGQTTASWWSLRTVYTGPWRVADSQTEVYLICARISPVYIQGAELGCNTEGKYTSPPPIPPPLCNLRLCICFYCHCSSYRMYLSSLRSLSLFFFFFCSGHLFASLASPSLFPPVGICQLQSKYISMT